jgi:dipeptidyl aminopeptidase/acylaminoacyl peptidase
MPTPPATGPTWPALVAALLLPTLAAAQGTRPITQDTYDLWRTISGATLSPDGRWAAWTESPVVGDGTLLIRDVTGATPGPALRIPRGFTGRPVLAPAADSSARFDPQPAQFSADGRWLAALIYPPQAAVEQARRQRVRAADQPRPSMVLVDLGSGRQVTVPRVRSFRFARDGGRWLAYQVEPDSAVGRDTTRPPAGPRRDPGTPLVLRDLTTDTETRIAEVTAYAFDEREQWLGYTVQSRTGATDGAYVRRLASGEVRPLLTGRGSFRQLVFDRAGAQVAFVSDVADSAAARPRFSLYHARLVPAKGRPVAAAAVLVGAAAAGAGRLIADRGRLEFTRDGSTLVFPLAPVPTDTVPADSLADKAIYDLWHWQDARIQPQQKVEAARTRARTWPAAVQLATGRWSALGSDTLAQVSVAEGGRVALALDPVRYAVEATWGDGASDAWLIDVASGERRRIAERLDFGAQLSPGGGFVTWFANGRWHAHEVATGRTVDLTGALRDVRFDQETWDTPDTPAPWGIAGWTTGDARVLVHDRFDLWALDPRGVAPPRNVTEGTGRARGITFRVVDLDPDDRFVDPAAPLVLRAVDSTTKDSGYWRDTLGDAAPPVPIVTGPRAYGGLQKARRAERYLLTRQTYREFPDLWVGGTIAETTRLSDANPQQAEYPWGTVELVDWLDADGMPLRGLLYKPQGFDPSKRYPLVVYYYEQLSDNLHAYSAPSGRNVVNPVVYTSLGYLVFMPDIRYTPGYPGPSAVKSIVPGVQALIARGYVDPAKLGITGQSWGGYQTAYLITQTNLFAAAVPNATVVNMTSAYGGIRWQSGLARAFQYERTQSRIGGSIWEYPERFVENSPLFHLDRVRTPVLFMANDNDGAVPWYQGIEFYVAMRRLGKEAYMVVYNGDEHNPTKRANQKDIDRKMQEFFGAKLLGQPAPAWMTRGIPFVEKGRDQLAVPMAPAGVSAPAAPPR